MNNLEISIKKLHEDARVPQLAHATDAGADLYSTDEVILQPGERVLISTGIAVALPEGYVGFVQPRSGLAIKHGISMVNTPGTIDAGYHGEIKVILINHDLHEPFTVLKGDRIAQFIIQRVERPVFTEVDDLPETERGVSGFGSTGVQG